jgi:hypothetical protein
MKEKKIKLDIDYIGGEGALTVAEESAISIYLKERKAISKRLKIKPKSKKAKQPEISS